VDDINKKRKLMSIGTGIGNKKDFRVRVSVLG
jgi:hypothetical protein